jgi:cystathionine beta-synthase
MLKTKERRILNNILEAIGNTPMIRLNKLPQEDGVECEVLVKCEFLNPTGSHKDRLGLNLIETAEQEGRLKPGGTIVEATSGNTGLGLAVVGAVKGYKVVTVALPKASAEKCDLIRGFGAKVIRAGTNLSIGPDSMYAIAERIAKETPNTFYTSQFTNKANPLTHYRKTANEIVDQCGGKIDYFFMAPGTGGTISGGGRCLKERLPSLKIVACDPVGSAIGGGKSGPFLVEGVGKDMVPPFVDLTIMDDWVKFNDKDAFETARRLMKEEGMSIGGSAGGVLWSALHYAKEKKLGKDQTIVVFLPDTGRNYLTKFLSNDWMLEHALQSEEEYRSLNCDKTTDQKYDIIELKDIDCKTLSTVKLGQPLSEIWELLKKEGMLIVNSTGKSEDGDFKGMLYCKDVVIAVISGRVKLEDQLDKVLKPDYCVLSSTLKISTVLKMLEVRDFLLFLKEGSKKIFVLAPADLMSKIP